MTAYTHFIILSFSGSELNSQVEKLKAYVRQGGVIIGYRNTLNWLDRNEFIDLDFKSTSRDAKNIAFDQRRKFRGAEEIGGAIFNTKIDRSHPINFGIHSNELPVFKNTRLFLSADKNSYNNPIQYTNSPLLNGYISKENLAVLKNTSYFKSARMGRGKVIAFTDNTNFRAFWYGTNRLLTNAIFLQILLNGLRPSQMIPLGTTAPDFNLMDVVRTPRQFWSFKGRQRDVSSVYV